jgi:hypothetical protein
MTIQRLGPLYGRDVLIGLSGEPIKVDNPAAARFLGRLASPSSDIGLSIPTAAVPATDFRMPSPSVKARDQGSIEKILNDLFEWTPAANRYQSFFLMLPAYFDVLRDVKAPVFGQNPPGSSAYLYRPYNLAKADVGLKVQYQPQIVTTANAFKGTSPDFDPVNAIFVRVDGFANQVPIYVAQVLESNFISGLVTRLVLGQYVRAWQGTGSKITAKDIHLSIPPSQPIAGDIFVKKETWPDNKDNYRNTLNTILDQNPITPAGLLWGWAAGQELDELTDGDVRFRNDVWKLIGTRFTSQDIGAMTSFTLNYMVGYALNERIKSIASAVGGAPIPAPVVDPKTIFLGLANDTINDLIARDASGQDQPNMRFLTKYLFHRVLGEFYALSKNQNLPANEKTSVFAQYSAFLEGFNNGSMLSADVIYHDVFNLAYGLGYSDGYRDGYARGYTNGYKDGYAAGYKQAWAEANVIISRLSSELNDAQNNNSFWDNAGRIASGVATVVGFVASLL